MTYKKIMVFSVIILLVLVVYAQVELDGFLNIKGVKILLENSTIENMEQDGNKLSVEINGKEIQIEQSDDSFVDVTMENCTKLGFVYLPGYDYEFMNETTRFIEGGWSLGIAYSRNDNFERSLDEMTSFIEVSHRNNLKPIVRILGNNWQDEMLPSETLVNFINDLEKATEKEFYVQIWDKPNVHYGSELSPEEYSEYVSDISQQTEVKIIGASLSLGSAGLGNYNRTKSEIYLSKLLEKEEYWDSIDYWGSNLYNPVEEGNCVNVTEIEFYFGQRVCSSTNYNYRYELERIKRETGKEYQVVLTEVGYPFPQNNIMKTKELLEQVKADPHVKAGVVFVANGWDLWESSSWLNENRTFKPFVSEMLVVCGN